jgi:glycerol-3-phosphate dehydrogenase (NAD(P)+)
MRKSSITQGAHFGIIGAGGWGTALAVVINRAGSGVTLWTRNDNVLRMIADKRVNDLYLSDVFIDPDICITSDLTHVAKECSHILLAVPSQQVRPICIALSDRLPSGIPVIIAAKGIERGSLCLMHEVVMSILPENPVMALSGPNFAREVAMGLPSATTLAGSNRTVAEKAIYAIGGRYFRPYYSDDIISVEVGGAVKNVLAIASGICTGRGLGENARAALITRGLAEMKRLAQAKGGREDTLSGLSGIGDLMLTCMSTASRNMAYGHAIGKQGKAAAVQTSETGGLTEGIATAESVYQLSRRLGVSMPICSMVYDVLQGTTDIDAGIEQLLSRPLGTE